MLAFCKLARAAALAGALVLPAAAVAQGWSGGNYGGYDAARDDEGGGRAGYDQDRGGGGQRRGDRDGGRGGWSEGRGADDDRRGWDDGRRYGDDRRRGDYDRRGWDDRRPGWGGGYGPGPGGQRWWHGRWWSYGAGPCWRWSQWRQNWKWVCD
jgi:hypothetical protein